MPRGVHAPPTRPLGVAERFNWILDLEDSTNFAVAVEVEGHLDRERLIDAIEVARQNHPMLRARVVVRSVATFEPGPDVPIPCEFIDDPTNEAWVAEVERQVDLPFAPESYPLARAFAFYGPSDTHFIIVINHAIGDGRSLSHVALQIVECAAGERADVEPRTARQPLEALYPPRYRGLVGRLRLLGALFHVIADVFRHGVPRKIPALRPPSQQPRQMHVLPKVLDVEVSSALIARCRAENTTVQGALMAANSCAVRARFGADTGDAISVTSIVDLRPRLVEPPSPDDLGYYVSVVPTLHTVTARPDFWALARDARAALMAKVDRGEAHTFWWTVLPTWLCPPNATGARRLAAAMAGGPQTTMITNVGRLDAPQSARVRGLRFAIAPPKACVLCMAASAIAGRIFLTCVLDKRVYSAAEAEMFVGEILATIEAAVGEGQVQS